MTQLDLLNLEVRQDAKLDDFRAPSFYPILAALQQLIDGKVNELFLYGDKGVGKTHFLSAAHSHYSKNNTAIFVSLGDFLADVGALAGLEAFSLIVIDDVHLVGQSHRSQEALFHLINRANAHKSKLLFASRTAPSELGLSFVDLWTRLNRSLSFALPDGTLFEDRQATLKSILRHKGWQIPDEVFAYLLEEGPYQAGDMLKVLNAITPLFNYRYRGRLPQKLLEEIKNAIHTQSLMVELSDLGLPQNQNLSLF